MLLFAISFLLIFASSFFITSILVPRKSIPGLIYLFLIAFAQIVLTFEILSLFTAIKQIWVIIFNVLFFIASAVLWKKKSMPIWSLDSKEFRNRINNSFKLDKSLIWLYIGFCVLLITATVICLLMPVTSADANAYHVARSLFWVLQGSLNHFTVPDVRNLCLPINSEILYAWVLLLAKKDIFFGFFSLTGFLLSIISIYNILGYLGYCVRKRLWTIFILSSFSSVIVQLSGTETDIIISGLVLSSLFLFWTSLRTNERTPLFMSALAYALAIGTKTPSLMMIPGIGLLMLLLCFKYKKYKPFGLFLAFGFINFMIFSSYNYILNIIDFSNISGPQSFLVVSKNYYGIKGAIANFIKYIFMFFDFTGFRWADYVSPHVEAFRITTLKMVHLNYVKDGIYSFTYLVNNSLLEPVMGAGILGFSVFLPCLIWALLKPISFIKQKKIPKKTLFIFCFAVLFIMNVIVISYLLAYMMFSVRFVMSFMVLSSPILVYSYFSNKNPLKYIIVIFSLFYLMAVSTHLWARPFNKFGKILSKSHSVTELRYRALCKDFSDNPMYSNSICILAKKIKDKYTTENRILAFCNSPSEIFVLKRLEFDGYKVDFELMENAHNIDFNKYSIIVMPNTEHIATVLNDYENRKNYYKIKNNKVKILKRDTVPCFYVHNELIPNSQEQYPFQVKCAFTPYFFEKNHLEATGVAGVIRPDMNSKSYYVIYRNASLPLKHKK